MARQIDAPIARSPNNGCNGLTAPCVIEGAIRAAKAKQTCWPPNPSQQVESASRPLGNPPDSANADRVLAAHWRPVLFWRQKNRTWNQRVDIGAPDRIRT